MTECSGASQTHVDPTAKLFLADYPAEINADLQKEHRAKVRSLQHLSICTVDVTSVGWCKLSVPRLYNL